MLFSVMIPLSLTFISFWVTVYACVQVIRNWKSCRDITYLWIIAAALNTLSAIFNITNAWRFLS